MSFISEVALIIKNAPATIKNVILGCSKLMLHIALEIVTCFLLRGSIGLFAEQILENLQDVTCVLHLLKFICRL